MNSLEDCTNYLCRLGAQDINHTAQDDFLTHLTGVYHYCDQLNMSDNIMLAGLFHSIYGTDEFDEVSLPLKKRKEIRKLIGEYAERLVYFFCAVTSESFDISVRSNDPTFLYDRFANDQLEVREEEFNDLMWLKFINILEIENRKNKSRVMPNSDPVFRSTWRQVAERLGAQATTAFGSVFNFGLFETFEKAVVLSLTGRINIFKLAYKKIF